jgi:hypothetical protein
MMILWEKLGITQEAQRVYVQHNKKFLDILLTLTNITIEENGC